MITNGVFSLIKTIFNLRKYELSEYANPLYKIAFHLSCGRTCQAISKSPIRFFIAGSGALDMKNISSQIFVSCWYYFVDCFTFPVTIDKFYLESFGRSKEFRLWLLGFVWLNILVLMKFQFVSQLSNLKYNLLIY